MNRPPHTTRPVSECSVEALQDYVAHRLSDAAGVALERHLDGCFDCRLKLDQLAAAPEFWAEAASSLAKSPEQSEMLRTLTGETGSREITSEGVERFVQTCLSPTDEPTSLGRLASYEVTGVVGFGSMGIVVKAFDRTLNRFVAIKVLSPVLAGHGSPAKRFQREARAAASVVHPNVIGIHSIAEWKGMPYLVMPYVAGESLQARIDREGPLSVEETVRVGIQIASALEAAHAQGLIHRDIKPSNILLEDGVERLVVSDFGLARASDDASLTHSGVIAGTPQYMSPEQAAGDTIDHRSDLFSLGSLLFTACTGRPPFRAETAFGVMRRIAEQTPRNPQEINPRVPGWLCRLIERLHAKSPAKRIGSASEVSGLLQQCLAHLQQPHVKSLPTALNQRKRAAVPVLPVALVLCLLLVTAYFGQRVIRGQGTKSRAAGTDQTTGAKSDSKSVPAIDTSGGESATTKPTSRYTFQVPDGHACYSLTMSVDMEESDLIAEGIVDLVGTASEKGQAVDVLLACDVRVSESAKASTVTDESSRERLASHWQRWQQSNEVRITPSGGEPQSEKAAIALPFDVGSARALVLPGLTKVNTAGQPSAQGVVTWTTKSPKSTMTYTFDGTKGVITAVEGQLRTEDRGEPRLVQLQLTLITDKDREAWLANVSKPGKLSPDDEQRCLSELREDRRTMYWLHRISGCDPKSLSSELVDAVAVIAEHPRHASRMLAKRIIARIPDDQLNPFRVED